MYPWLQSLFLFVARHIKHYLEGVTDSRLPDRLVLPYERTDVLAEGSDDRKRPDLGLGIWSRSRGIGPIGGRTEYAGALAIVKAKGEYAKGAGKPDEPQLKLGAPTRDAFEQLFMYMHQVYLNQCNWQFVWGISQSCAETHVCIFVNNGTIVSHAMNLHMPEGRCQFVQLLVDWSLCKPPLLGYDPTIEWLDSLKCWRIDMPSIATNTDMPPDTSSVSSAPPYYFSRMYVEANHLFGHHTCCFPATMQRSGAPVSDENPITPDAVVKDAWPYVEHGDVDRGKLGEVAFLKNIRQKLAESNLACHWYSPRLQEVLGLF
ncbi:hypothetical protein LPJ61_004533 [Coemansia biformis]|uniref:Fungal-type protein kinase domain-containing protein n=1 Tax=Coemansia biformis TaxID=1286918 RepID=A0A9W7Y8F1_9FUNG|nr:hypothetical protein LPJ61_004533 [Coemansia biformis]